MTDEKFCFISEVKEKGTTARSARHARTHNGKGGRMKTPSDFMTKKEREKLNGEVKSYRMNDPMNWNEFKALPDDLKVAYINLIREKFDAPDSYIAEMMGIHKVTMCNFMKTLGCPGRRRSSSEKWDKEAFLKWVNGVPECCEEPVEEDSESVIECPDETAVDIPEEPICQPVEADSRCVPCDGRLTFRGNAETALKTVAALLGGADVYLEIRWNSTPERACE